MRYYEVVFAIVRPRDGCEGAATSAFLFMQLEF